ncbi:hypothetical protein H9Q10_09485 [Eikenella sp. S3360]|uniref:Secreted protein n=1 Tax=Eikenella glucosivorans TaxID=2766967 RepID=A0ABS0NC72_9NEIS|nr:hypothetical protein [Eikenella glucosivorans]MBH5329896.1 hypothetical protein [Eikenella glucosivorans]
MPLSPRAKTLLALAVLLALAGGHFAVRQWRAAQQPAAAAAPQACNPRQGCSLPNGSRIRFAAALREPFDIELENVPPEVRRVEVSFSMANMDMGFNRYPLARRPNGSWLAAQIRLPVCTDRRHDYLADVRIGEQVFQVAFEAQ